MELEHIAEQDILISTKDDEIAELKRDCGSGNALLLEHSTKVEDTTGLQLEGALIQSNGDGFAQLVVSNLTGCSCTLEGGTPLGEAARATLVVEPELDPSSSSLVGECTQSLARVGAVQSFAWRKQRLWELIGEPNYSVKPEQTEELHAFLSDYHEVFYIEEQEQGETDLVEMEIHTGMLHPEES